MRKLMHAAMIALLLLAAGWVAAPQKASASQSYLGFGFADPADQITLAATGSCTWDWSLNSSGRYTDMVKCTVIDVRNDGRGILVRLFVRDKSSDPWQKLTFNIVNGVLVAEVGRCSIATSGATKICQRNRWTYSANTQFKLRACLAKKGVCDASGIISGVFPNPSGR